MNKTNDLPAAPHYLDVNLAKRIKLAGCQVASYHEGFSDNQMNTLLYQAQSSSRDVHRNDAIVQLPLQMQNAYTS